jgi:hypothetical protein
VHELRLAQVGVRRPLGIKLNPSRSVVRVSGLALILAGALPASAGAAQCAAAPVAPICTATADKPVAICFAVAPLTVDHCGPELTPNFSIDIWHAAEAATVGYRYSYQLIANGRPGRVERFEDQEDPNAYPFTETPDLSGRRLPFSGSAKYSLRVTVSPDGMPEHSEISDEVVLDDKPRIRGLSVGISHYANAAFTLNYADADAKAFQTTLTTLLAAKADVRIDRRTSDENEDMKKDTLLTIIRQVAVDADQDEASRLSGPNDWYVFYFSGHGIVGVNHQGEVGRYISTKSFDPTHLPQTSIRLSELAEALYDTDVKNLLVILDSCFSGFHTYTDTPSSGTGRGGRSTVSTPIMKGSGKVLYVANDKVVPYQVGGNGDAQAFPNKLSELEGQGRRALVVAAASADREAEEGPVSYQQRSDGRILLDFDRSNVDANAGKPGHGLFTFAWLANLLAQLPKSTDISALLSGARAPVGQRDCMLDFDSAASKAKDDIHDLGEDKGLKLQIPEATTTKTVPPLVACAAQVR